PTWTISSAQNRVQATDLHRLAQTVIPISFTPQSVPELIIAPFIRILASGTTFGLYQNSMSPYLDYFNPVFWPGTPQAAAFNSTSTQPEILAKLAPAPRLKRRRQAMLDIGEGYTETQGLQIPTLWTSPQIDIPAYAPLVKLSGEYLLPNLDRIPDNSVSLAKVNRNFIEAYLTGMNHEMLRELMWREFPTTQQGTIFSYFWDHNDERAGGSAPSADIKNYADWDPNSEIGTHGLQEEEGPVLVIRGELLRRYPDTVIYAAELELASGAITREVYPTFSAKIDPDIVLLGFPEELNGVENPGSTWYFVFQERPGAPRFGLDVLDPDAVLEPPLIPQDLNWGHVALENGHLHIAHPDNPGAPLEWGQNAAIMASLFYQDPVRVALHAPDLVGSPAILPSAQL
ncbi:MAG: hypothetical protein AAF570_19150, partial [Bacteroidota bacterium]